MTERERDERPSSAAAGDAGDGAATDVDPNDPMEGMMTRVGASWRADAHVGGGDLVLCDRLATIAVERGVARRSEAKAGRRSVPRSFRVALVFAVIGGTTWAVASRLLKPPSEEEVTAPVALSAASRVTAEGQPRASAAPELDEAPVAAQPEAVAAPRTSASEPGPSERPTANSLLRAAAAARASGDVLRARDSYRRLGEAYPHSVEAQVARVALGRILMDSFGDAQGALVEFDAYLRKGGSLSEEALVGRALALGRLGRRDAELAAWRRLLASFPRSVHAQRAKARESSLALEQGADTREKR